MQEDGRTVAKFSITSILFDGDGTVIEEATAVSYGAELASASGEAWARGALQRASDPDAYVEHLTSMVGGED